MRSLETVLPLVVESAGVRVTPSGPSHWNSGVPVTPSGRVTEQVKVTDPPATTEEEEEEAREMVAGSGESLCSKPTTSTAVCTYSDIMWCSSLSTG